LSVGGKVYRITMAPSKEWDDSEKIGTEDRHSDEDTRASDSREDSPTDHAIESNGVLQAKDEDPDSERQQTIEHESKPKVPPPPK
jgi:hypothetical protein